MFQLQLINFPSDRKHSTDFNRPKESLRRCPGSQLRRVRFYPTRERVPLAGTINLTWPVKVAIKKDISILLGRGHF